MLKKKSLLTAVVIGLALLLSFPLTAFAVTSGDYDYEVLEDTTVRITAYHGSETSVTIPSTLDSKTVSEIGSGVFSGKTNIASVVVPGSIKKINSGAFSGCTGLTGVTLNEGLEWICGGAFMGCTSLTAISIPDTVKYIDFTAFKNCTLLADFTLSATSQLETIGQSTFENCAALTAINLPDTLNFINEDAFSGCTHLASIEIPADVTEIQRGTFKGCTALGTVTLNEGLTQIGGEAFRNCTDLSSITIPDSVEEISFLTFAGCTHLGSVQISVDNSSLQYIGENAFNNCDALTSIDLPRSLLGVVAEAFSGCDNLDVVYISSQTAQLLQYNEDDGHFIDIFGSSSYSGCAGTGTTYLTQIFGFGASTAKEYVEYVNSNVHASDGHEITFHSMDIVLNNEENHVKVAGDLSDDITLDVSTLAVDSEEYQNAVKNIGDDKMLLLLDINLMLGEEPVQPNGDVIVTILIPEEYRGLDNLVVAYIDDDGVVTYLECTINEDGTISFITDHFSNYALMQKIETVVTKTTSPQTGDTTNILLWITLCVLSMSAVYVIRKHKINN